MFGLRTISNFFKKSAAPVEDAPVIVSSGVKEAMSYLMGMEVGELSHNREIGYYNDNAVHTPDVLAHQIGLMMDEDSFDFKAFQDGHAALYGAPYDMDADYLGIAVAREKALRGDGIELHDTLQFRNA